MHIATQLTTTFHCSLERAFRAPILGDATRFLGGYLLQPPVIGFEDDATWGRPGGVRYPVTAGNLFLRKGRTFRDVVLERVENVRWKWMIHDFYSPSFWFTTQGIGEWEVTELAEDRVAVLYRYTFTARAWWAWPMCFLYVRVQHRGMMRKALRGIQAQAESSCAWVYEV